MTLHFKVSLLFLARFTKMIIRPFAGFAVMLGVRPS